LTHWIAVNRKKGEIAHFSMIGENRRVLKLTIVKFRVAEQGQPRPK
jgi:hypothetical protein